jgi:hypothetical protein
MTVVACFGSDLELPSLKSIECQLAELTCCGTYTESASHGFSGRSL